jgi:hypothetical protein
MIEKRKKRAHHGEYSEHLFMVKKRKDDYIHRVNRIMGGGLGNVCFFFNVWN